MENFLSSKKVLWLFLAIGALAVLVALVIALSYSQQGQQSKAPEFPKFEVKHTEVPVSQMPDRFPTGLPLEANAKVTDNYNSTASNGSFQATRQYESIKSPTENYRTFDTYFRRNGWTVLSASGEAADKSLTVKKGNTIIQALFHTNSVSKASVVRISVTILPE